MILRDLNKVRGVIYGLAIGDALGKDTEFFKINEIKNRYGKKGIRDLPEQALYTDDTQMSIAIAEALVKSGKKDIKTIMENVSGEFIKWLNSPENNRAPGYTCIKGVENLEKGIHWSESGVEDSKGCGSAMRSGIIGYFYQNNPEKLRDVAHYSGICTHGHPTADAACIGAAYLVKLALDNTPKEEIIPRLCAFTSNISEEWDKTLSRLEKCLDWNNEEKALEYLGEGWVGDEAVALGLYCFLRYPDNYKKAIIRGANTNGDSDSIACIAGSISGAYLEKGAIPEKWIQSIENSSYLDNLAKRLAQSKTN